MGKQIKVLLAFWIAILLALESDASYDCDSKKNPVRRVVEFYAEVRNFNRDIYCGGTFIRADAVLTSAYCLFTRRKTIDKNVIKVTHNPDVYFEKHEISYLIPYPAYVEHSPINKENDIGLILLQLPNNANPSVIPINYYMKGDGDKHDQYNVKFYVPEYSETGVAKLLDTVGREDKSCPTAKQAKGPSFLCASQYSGLLKEHSIGSGALRCHNSGKGNLKLFAILSGFGSKQNELVYTFLKPYTEWITYKLHSGNGMDGKYCTEASFRRLGNGSYVGDTAAYAWHAKITNHQKNTKCLGALIYPDVIASAAVCFDEKVKRPKMTIEFATTTLTTLNINEVHVFKEIAVITLKETITIDPVPVFQTGESFGKSAWHRENTTSLILGIEQDFVNGQRTMMFVNVVENSDCKMPETAETFCSKTITKKQSLNDFDIGTPLLYCESKRKIARVYGILFKFDNAHETQGYVAIDYFNSFIEDIRRRETVEHGCESLPYHARDSDTPLSSMVRIVMELPINKLYFAMGSLIHPEFVLTSAKAIQPYAYSPDAQLYVHFTTQSSQSRESIRAIKHFIPETYAKRLEHDVALLQLEKHLVSDYSVYPHIKVDTITTALLVRYSKDLARQLQGYQYIFSTYQNPNAATKRIETRPTYVENQIECGPATKTCLCTRWSHTPDYKFVRDLGAPLLFCDTQTNQLQLIGIFIGHTIDHQRFSYLMRYSSWITQVIAKASANRYCGGSSRRIFDGRNVDAGEQMAAGLVKLVLEANNVKISECWGVVVTKNKILFLSSCLKTDYIAPNSNFQYKLFFGNYFVEHPVVEVGNSSINTVFYHPRNNLAILRLNKDLKDIIPPGSYKDPMEMAQSGNMNHFIGEYGTIYSRGTSRGNVTQRNLKKTFLVLYNSKFCSRHGGSLNMGNKACFSSTDWRQPTITDIGAPIVMCDPESKKFKVYGLLSNVILNRHFSINIFEWAPASAAWFERV